MTGLMNITKLHKAPHKPFAKFATWFNNDATKYNDSNKDIL